ncbi:MAG: hypothetical protein CL484_06750 [Acidobacteria bacterium]|nr:hypothetical protein [Acidobacteriota bacterium]
MPRLLTPSQSKALVHRRLVSWAAAFPHSEATFHGAIASGNTVVLEYTWNVTRTGPMPTPKGEVVGTGKSASVRSASVIEMRDGKAASCRQYFDLNTLFTQLGLV